MSAVDFVGRGHAQQSLLNPSFLKEAMFQDRIRIVAGIDSLTDGGGSPSSTWRSTFTPYAKSVLGSGGPGLINCQRNGDPDYTGFGLGNGMSYITGLAWNNAIRQKSFFGAGLYTTASTNAYFGCGVADETNLLGWRLICELRSDDALFKWRMNSTNENMVSTGDTISVAGGYAKNVLLDLFRPVTPSVGGVKGISIEGVVGDCTFYAMEAVRSTPGVTVTNLGLAGTKASDWAQLDDTRMRDFIRLMNADVALLNMGMNDRLTDKGYTFGRNLATIVDRFKVIPATNVILIRPNDASDAASSHLNEYTNVIRGVANSRGCGFMDVRDALGDWATALAAGYSASADVHPTPTGNAQIDLLIRRKLRI